MLTAAQVATATDIAKNGDPNGDRTEQLMYDASYVADPNYTADSTADTPPPAPQDPKCNRYMDVKYSGGSNKGMDVVVVDGYDTDKSSNPIVVVFECKPWSGGVDLGTGYGAVQLSAQWMQGVLDATLNEDSANAGALAVQAAKNQGNLLTSGCVVEPVSKVYFFTNYYLVAFPVDAG